MFCMAGVEFHRILMWARTHPKVMALRSICTAGQQGEVLRRRTVGLEMAIYHGSVILQVFGIVDGSDREWAQNGSQQG
jgi:hypothetical protein